MKTDIYIRFSERNVVLDKMASLTLENNLVYQDEGEPFQAHLVTTTKFALLTLASPLIAVARMVRSIAFACLGEFNRAGTELIGGLATPLIASGCLIGSFLSTALYVLSFEEISLYVQMRRTYGHFEAWINGIDLESSDLVSYSKRMSSPFDCVGDRAGIHENVWTTAPCMQPLLEKGESSRGGLLDVERMRKIFPHVKMNNVLFENGKIVVQSEYSDKAYHEVTCNGACEHARLSYTCCCCYRIDAAFDRVLCCEVGQGNCSSMADSSNSCGISFCTFCGLGVCCCRAKTNNLDLIEVRYICP